jgi:predicted metal-dependent hydrolase
MLRWRNRKHYLKLKEDARALVHARVGFYNAFYNHNVGKVFIKNTKSRWGSCSQKGNLNFNYKIVLLPPALADYIIIHELCHLKEFNHGPKFWALVSQCCPNYRQARAALRQLERA